MSDTALDGISQYAIFAAKRSNIPVELLLDDKYHEVAHCNIKSLDFSFEQKVS